MYLAISGNSSISSLCECRLLLRPEVSDTLESWVIGNCESLNVDAENQTQVLCKRKMYSKHLVIFTVLFVTLFKGRQEYNYV